VKTWSRFPLVVCLALCACLVALLASLLFARVVFLEHGGRLVIGVGEANEPLFFYKVFKDKLKTHQNKKKSETLNKTCRKAIEDNDEEGILKHCKKSPKTAIDAPEETEIRTAKKKTKKKIKATTRLRYKNPGQAFGHEGREKWDRLVVRPPSTGDMTARQFRSASSNTRDKARGRGLLGSTPGPAAVNDDSDCYDRVTGTHATTKAASWARVRRARSGRPRAG
jgi:hypothetical protein